MTGMPAQELLASVRRRLAPREDANRLLPLIEDGSASMSVIGDFAAQQRRIIASDRRSFLTLAARTADGPAGSYFADFAAGESEALDLLGVFATACGLPDDASLLAREPLAGCQAYPAYLAWLALNGDAGSVVLALTVSFAAWGAYCGRLGHALRAHYGFDDRACAFVDFFAGPEPEAEARAIAAIGADPCPNAMTYGRLSQDYELMFWTSLADRA